MKKTKGAKKGKKSVKKGAKRGKGSVKLKEMKKIKGAKEKIMKGLKEKAKESPAGKKAVEKEEKGITAEKDEFSEWFSQLMIKADLSEYTDVSGCIIFKPSAYAMWEKIREEVDKRFKKIGVKNAYFPLLIPEKFLVQEEAHVKGFSPQVAWVTRAGDSELSEKLAIRPTSEAIMYPSYSKWIRSWRDLPLKINQWNNVVRWEFSHPVPFMRTREFLWNELHTALATEREALEEGKKILNIYKEVCEEFLGLYGVAGRKTESEKFAGAVFSEKLHYIMPIGKSIEGACFHHDGQNFAKAYDIKFLDKDSKIKYVWQNTYAISTRMLGVMFAIHSDGKGLILPPKIAPNKVVIVPILFEDTKAKVLREAERVKKELEEFDVILDDREGYSPGFKFNEWELKGIPIRVEIGPKDIESGRVVVSRRDTGKKENVAFAKLKKFIERSLNEMQKALFEKSKKIFNEKLERVGNLAELKKVIENKKIALVPMCKNPECEGAVRYETGGAKTLYISDEKVKNEKCAICRKKADYLVYIGKSY